MTQRYHLVGAALLVVAACAPTSTHGSGSHAQPQSTSPSTPRPSTSEPTPSTPPLASTPPPAIAPPTVAPAVPTPIDGVVRDANVDVAHEASLRSDVHAIRADISRARRQRGRAAEARVAVLRVELETMVGALAMALCTGFAPARIQAYESLDDLESRARELREGLDPHVFRDCMREGGDEADCTLLEGQPESELGEAENELARAYEVANIRGMVAECAPGDTDLALE